jgi:membrane protein DedA with SNARE-associated domain
LSRERISEAEERIRAHEMRAVILGRLIPGLRIVTVIAAGVIGVRPAKFLPGLAIGGFFYLLVYTVLSAVVGPPIINTFTRLAIPAGELLSMAGLLIVLFTVRTMRPSEGARFAMRGAFGMAAAGVLAAFAGLLSSNSVVGVIAMGGQLSDRVTDLGLAQRV